MTTTITALDQLDPALVEQTLAEITTMLQEAYPEIELTRGPIHDYLLYISGQLAAVNQTNINRYLASRSLQQITADPTLADDDMVDDVLSNHRITRSPGSAASGVVTIVINANASVIIPAGFVLEANGQQFITTTSFAARPIGSTLQAETDRQLTQLSDDNYAFTINVLASEIGPAGNITRGTKLTPQVPPLRFVSAYAAADFTGGFDAETNEQLIARLALGDAKKTLDGGSLNIESAIRNQTAFERIVACSIIGMGDAEMSRDQHWIFPASGGGRVDIYAKTRDLPQAVQKTITATLVTINADSSIWQFTLDRDAAPGYYEAARIVLPSASPDDSSFEVVQDIRGTDQRANERQNDIVNSQESAYTRFQTGVIQFEDTLTDVTTLTVGDTATYLVDLLAMPLIDQIQDFCNHRNNSSRASDFLVKAAVPCFLSVNLQIDKAASEDTPDTDAIQAAVANAVNAYGFVGRLSSAVISGAAHAYLTGHQTVSGTQIFGRIRHPNGKVTHLRSDGATPLELPDKPTEGVTKRTTIFVLNPQDVAITVRNVSFGDA